MPDVKSKPRVQLLYVVIIALLALVLAISLTLRSPGSADSGTLAARTGPPGSIAFVSDRDGNNEIYVIQPNGGGLLRLTDDPATELMPAWSLDGTRLAFVSDRGGTLDVYVMDADGSNVQQLTDSPGADSAPQWSPDGRQVVFVSDRDGPPQIFVVNNDGTGERQISSGNVGHGSPAWSPTVTPSSIAATRRAIRDHADEEFGETTGQPVAGPRAGLLAEVVPVRLPDRIRIHQRRQLGDLCHGRRRR